MNKEDKIEIIENNADEGLEKLKLIAEKYSQLESCNGVLSDYNKRNIRGRYLMYMNDGWKIMHYKVEDAGIDLEKIYKFIEQLAIEKKQEIEDELKGLTG